MAFTTKNLRNRVLADPRTPGAMLTPKPGMLQAGGNQPKPILDAPEQSNQPKITPAGEYKPQADPVNPTNSPLSYQEAFTQGRLTPGAGVLANNDPTSAGGYGGYDPNKPPAGYDPNAWAINAPGGIDTRKGWYVDERTGQQVRGVKSYAPGADSATFTGLEGLTPEQFQALDPAKKQAMMSQFTPQEMYKYGLWQKPAEEQLANLPEWLTPGFTGDAAAASGLEGYTPAGPKLSGPVAKGVGVINKTSPPSITPKGTEPIASTAGVPATPAIAPKSAISPEQTPAPSPVPVTGEPAADNSLNTVFNYFRKELERERDKSLSDADVEAASRGVFYGTPGTQPREEIRERFGRGLADLEAQLLQREQENELSRLGLATNLFGTLQQGELGRLGLMTGLIPQDLEATGGVDPALFQALASLFGGQGGEEDITDKVTPTPTVKPVSIRTPVADTSQPAKTLPRLGPTMTKRQTKAIKKGKR